MLSRESTESFIQTDARFFDSTRTLLTLDPLGFHEDDTLASFRQKITPHHTDNAEHRLADWLGEHPNATDSELRAARRDFDKVLGHRAATGRATVGENLDEVLCDMSNRTEEAPRATIYDYAIGGEHSLHNTYTSDEREINLLSIFETSLSSAHVALWSILRARYLKHEGQSQAEIESALTSALEYAEQMHRPMIRAYRDVGPTFVAQELTRYTCAISTSRGAFEGPNPSHSGFVVLDRFAYGSFEPLYERQPSLRDMYDYRIADMPLHLRGVMSEADAVEDTQPLTDLAHEVSAQTATIAHKISDMIRKFKTVHRSYADKALTAKGKTLNPDEPDVLGEIINYARTLGETT